MNVHTRKMLCVIEITLLKQAMMDLKAFIDHYISNCTSEQHKILPRGISGFTILKHAAIGCLAAGIHMANRV